MAASSGRGGGATPSRAPPRRARRGKPGFWRRSAIKKSFHQEQMVFATPMPDGPPSPSSAAGPPASRAAPPSPPAASAPSSSTRGCMAFGGRMAIRVVDGGEQPVFDHKSQFFTATDESFQKLVDEWLGRGLVREWRGLIGEIEAGGRFRPNGMRPLADAILPELIHRLHIDQGNVPTVCYLHQVYHY